ANAAPTTGITRLNITTPGRPNATQQTGIASGNITLVEESNDFVGLTNESSVFNASNETYNLNSINTTTSDQYPALTLGITGLNTTTPGRPNATQQTGNLTVVEGSNDFVGLTNQSSLISASNETNIPGLAETSDLSSANAPYQNSSPTTGLTGENVILVEGSNDERVIRPTHENSLRRSSRQLLQHKYNKIGDLARMNMGNITYKCYSVRVKGKNKVQINKGCVAMRPEQNACALLADKYGAEALEGCQVCLEGKCNRSYGNALRYSAKIWTLTMSIGWLIGAVMNCLFSNSCTPA
ncbi:uncharacterized protein LOC118748316, partial [Rhagoletis pomonella]|uniref:uncharacterized protein LOC118748316 n=1 Tax=Rhagoletis pomonella TaxID=28610 RepID=UPI00177B6ADD